jgi:hypothetical protein
MGAGSESIIYFEFSSFSMFLEGLIIMKQENFILYLGFPQIA